MQKISQEELAEKLGVARQSISKWETGENYPSMQNIMCLCKIFKCKINELVHEDFVDINFLDEEIKMSVVKFKKEEQKKLKGVTKFLFLFGKLVNTITIIAIVVVAIFSIGSTYVLSKTNINTKENIVILDGKEISYEIKKSELVFNVDENNTFKVQLMNDADKNVFNDVIKMSKVKRISLVLLIELSFIISIFLLNRLSKNFERLFKNIHDKETPFEMDNIRFIKNITLFTLLYIAAQDVIGMFAQLVYRIDFNIEIEFKNYILVLVLFAISFIFKYGYEIQLD